MARGSEGERRKKEARERARAGEGYGEGSTEGEGDRGTGGVLFVVLLCCLHLHFVLVRLVNNWT